MLLWTTKPFLNVIDSSFGPAKPVNTVLDSQRAKSCLGCEVVCLSVYICANIRIYLWARRRYIVADVSHHIKGNWISVYVRNLVNQASFLLMVCNGMRNAHFILEKDLRLCYTDSCFHLFCYDEFSLHLTHTQQHKQRTRKNVWLCFCFFYCQS